MPAIELTVGEVLAIDTACMALQELGRGGRQHQADATADGEPDVAEWYATSTKIVDDARASLRALLDRLKDGTHAND